MSIDLVCGDPRGGGQADVREREAGGRAVISRPFPLTVCFVLLLLGLHLQCQTPEILWPLAGCSFVKVDTKHNYNGWNVGVCWCLLVGSFCSLVPQSTRPLSVWNGEYLATSILGKNGQEGLH